MLIKLHLYSEDGETSGGYGYVNEWLSGKAENSNKGPVGSYERRT